MVYGPWTNKTMSKNIINALPELIKEGLITDETSEKIKAYYKRREQQQPNRMNLVFGIIGSILVGLGIILIVAHNWDKLDRPVKLVFSFAPLVIGQLLCGYVLLRKPENYTWKESCATFLFFAVGASIALVAQVYNIPGNIGSFLFTWMLLCFPLIYILPSSMASLLYVAGITAYAVQTGYGYRAAGGYHYWWLFALAIPHYLLLILEKPGSNFTLFHHWVLPISLTICLGTLAGRNAEYMTLAYISLFGTFYILGNSTWFSIKRMISNGYLVIGSIGTISLLLVLSFKDFWMDIAPPSGLLSVGELMAVIVPALLAFFLLIQSLRKKGNQPINPLSFIFLLFIAVFFVGRSAPVLGAILINLLVLAAAIFTMKRGIVLNHFGILNYGLLIIAVLVLCRFFDTDISFVIRGLLFVGVGAGFFFANSLLLKKRGTV